jgi:hypothetical protein
MLGLRRRSHPEPDGGDVVESRQLLGLALGV